MKVRPRTMIERATSFDAWLTQTVHQLTVQLRPHVRAGEQPRLQDVHSKLEPRRRGRDAMQLAAWRARQRRVSVAATVQRCGVWRRVEAGGGRLGDRRDGARAGCGAVGAGQAYCPVLLWP